MAFFSWSPLSVFVFFFAPAMRFFRACSENQIKSILFLQWHRVTIRAQHNIS
jgi:hypothetical protein